MNSFEFKSRFNNTSYSILKNILFLFDAESIHNYFLKTGNFLGRYYLLKKAVSSLFYYSHPSLEQEILGIKFRNPVGLSAGFDKNAELMDIIGDVGFGFIEVGSVTANPCSGNLGIRVKRLISKKSLWVNFGLNNQGALKIGKKFDGLKFDVPVGINIAKTNCPETADYNVGLKDYIYSLNHLRDEGDYFTINISCPNSFGGQPFSSPGLYRKLLTEVDKLKIRKPIFVKLSPDLNKKDLDSLIEITGKHNISGFICTNLTKNKRNGGYSGNLVKEKANALLSYVYKKISKSNKKYILIGSGGVSSADDAYEKIKLGASLVQLITGMIYHGPGLIGEINYGLVKLLQRDGFKNISEAVGTAY